MCKLTQVNGFFTLIGHLLNFGTKFINIIRKKGQPNYRFIELNKKVFIRKNGDGVIVCAFDFVVRDPNKAIDFERELDISDAKKSTIFPANMPLKKSAHHRFFSDYFFHWDSPEGIVVDVEEYYHEDYIKYKDNPKFIGLKFRIDKSKLVPKRRYRIVYAYSIPGLFPINDGYFDKEQAPNANYSFSSSMEVLRLSSISKIALYIEHGIQFKIAPMAKLSFLQSDDNLRSKDMVCEHRDNLLYEKYVITIDNPDQYRKIAINWDIQRKG